MPSIKSRSSVSFIYPTQNHQSRSKWVKDPLSSSTFCMAKNKGNLPACSVTGGFGMPFANMALRLFMASAVSLPPDSPRTLEELNVSVDWLTGSAHGLSSSEALKYVSGAIRAIDEWEKSHRTSKVYDSLDLKTQEQLAGLFKLRAELIKQLGQDYKLAIDDLRNCADLYERLGRRFDRARLLEEIGDIERRNGDAGRASVDYTEATTEYGFLYDNYKDVKNTAGLPDDALAVLGITRSEKESIIWEFRVGTLVRRAEAAQKGGDLVTAITALDRAREDLTTACFQNKLVYEDEAIRDQRLEAEIDYLERVQDGTIKYATASGFGPLLPADYQATKDAVEKVVAKYERFNFATAAQYGATTVSGLVKDVDHAIEQAERLSRYSKDMHFDAAEQLKAKNTVAELNGIGGRLSIAAGDAGNIGKYFDAAALKIYLLTGQYIKGVELSVQYAEALANKGQRAEAQIYFTTAGEYYQLAAEAYQTPAEKMLALELAGDMLKRGGHDLQARQIYEEAVVMEAKPGEDGSRLPEYRKRIVEKAIVIREELIFQAVMADLNRFYPNFDRLSSSDRIRTAKRCIKDWNRLSEADQMGWRGVGKNGAFIKGVGYVSERYISNWAEAQRDGDEADRAGGVEGRKDRDRVREGERPAAESRGAFEGRPGGIGK